MKNFVAFSLCFLFIAEAKAEELFSPLGGTDLVITCHFCGYRYQNGNCHGAIDYDTTDSTTPIFAAAGGIVKKVDSNRGADACRRGYSYGNHVLIKHNDNWATLYAHMLSGSITVTEGQRIEAGELLGVADSTGCVSGSHLHFEVRNPQNKPVDPYDNSTDQARCLVPNIPHTCGPNALWATCPPEPYPEDGDGDGYLTIDGDCDDRDPAVHPNQFETKCDYKDENCDGSTDEVWPLLRTNCSVGRGVCQRSATWVCEPGQRGIVCDTDGGTPQPETCNGRDDNCDGITDNGSNLCASDQRCANGRCITPGWADMACTDDIECQSGLRCINQRCTDINACPYLDCEDECQICSSHTCISSAGNGRYLASRGCPCESQNDCPRSAEYGGWRSYCLDDNYRITCNEELINAGLLHDCRCN